MGRWIDFGRYLNSELPLRNLLSAGFGKLADGPDFLVQAYGKVLTEASVEVSLGELWPTKVWTGDAWGRNRRRALNAGSRYVVRGRREGLRMKGGAHMLANRSLQADDHVGRFAPSVVRR